MHHTNSKIFILFLMIVSGFAWAATIEPSQKLIEMITIKDLESVFGIKAKGELLLKNDEITFPKTGYSHREYKYIDESGVKISNELIVCGSSKEANKTAQQYISGVENAFNKSYKKFKALLPDTTDKQMYHIIGENSEVIGMFYYIVDGNKFYKFWLYGLYFENYEQFQLVFGEKIKSILNSYKIQENV